MSEITHVAVRCKGKVYALPRPHRHPDVMRLAVADGADVPIEQYRQGFVDSAGRFLLREEAKRVAVEAGQVPDDGRRELYSEDLW